MFTYLHACLHVQRSGPEENEMAEQNKRISCRRLSSNVERRQNPGWSNSSLSLIRGKEITRRGKRKGAGVFLVENVEALSY